MDASPEPIKSEDTGRLRALTTITPLSKYFAIILFISLPFIGGYVGYVNAPEKILEKEVLIYEEEAEVGQSDTSLEEWSRYTGQGLNLSFEYPSHWALVETEREESEKIFRPASITAEGDGSVFYFYEDNGKGPPLSDSYTYPTFFISGQEVTATLEEETESGIWDLIVLPPSCGKELHTLLSLQIPLASKVVRDRILASIECGEES